MKAEGNDEGFPKVLKELELIERSLHGELLQRALVHAMPPMLRQSKRNAKAVANSGLLAKSIYAKRGSRSVSELADKGAWVAVGVEDAWSTVVRKYAPGSGKGAVRSKKLSSNPRKYAHLVEYGGQFGNSKQQKYRVAPRPLFQAAWQSVKRQFEDEYLRYVESGVLAAIRAGHGVKGQARLAGPGTANGL